METIEPLVRIADGQFSTGGHTRWLTDTFNQAPSIYDVDLNAVDQDAPWVRVKRRTVDMKSAPWMPHMLGLDSAMESHPTTRVQVKGVDVAYFKSLEDLPMWLRERIAVLNIADAGDWIKGVGKRWTLSEYAKTPNWSRDLNNTGRCYTIEMNCEGTQP